MCVCVCVCVCVCLSFALKSVAVFTFLNILILKCHKKSTNEKSMLIVSLFFF